jgi:hypothetical protein
MSVGETTVPAVQTKLLTLFKAATESDKTEVWLKRTNEDHQLEENIYLGEVRGRRQWRVLMGGSPRSLGEEYSIVVELELYRQGTDIEGTEARMWELAQALEVAVSSRPTLEGLAGISWTTSQEFQQQTTVDEDGVRAKYIFGVAVTARI